MARPRRPDSSGGGEPEVLLDGDGLRATVDRLAAALSEDHDDDSVAVPVLKGGMIVASDLLRRLEFHPRVDFLAPAPFQAGARAELVKDLSLDVRGARLILIVDVIDTGLSLQFLLTELERHSPRSVTVCTLVDKPHRRLLPVAADLVGITVEDDFLIGYGLDFAGRYRNLNLLAAADLERLAADPDCYRSWAYPDPPAGE